MLYTLNMTTLTMNPVTADLLSPATINADTNISGKLAAFEQNCIRFNEHLFEAETFNLAKDVYTAVLSGETPESIPNILKNGQKFSNSVGMFLHSAMADAGYFGRVTKEVAQDIAKNVKNGTVLDVMAGRGFAVKALREAGVKTIGTDNNSWNLSEDIEQFDALESVRNYGAQVTHILISWAPYESTIDLEILHLIRAEYPHITIIHIGEGYGGCTGSEEFIIAANMIEEEYPVRYVTTHGINDYLTFMN